jgi:hypothetical protein
VDHDEPPLGGHPLRHLLPLILRVNAVRRFCAKEG